MQVSLFSVRGHLKVFLLVVY